MGGYSLRVFFAILYMSWVSRQVEVLSTKGLGKRCMVHMVIMSRRRAAPTTSTTTTMRRAEVKDLVKIMEAKGYEPARERLQNACEPIPLYYPANRSLADAHNI